MSKLSTEKLYSFLKNIKELQLMALLYTSVPPTKNINYKIGVKANETRSVTHHSLTARVLSPPHQLFHALWLPLVTASINRFI